MDNVTVPNSYAVDAAENYSEVNSSVGKTSMISKAEKDVVYKRDFDKTKYPAGSLG